MPVQLTLAVLPHTFAICRLEPAAALPAWTATSAFLAITRSADELSIVCEQRLAPADVTAERDWRGLRVEGPLDFALTGILARLLAPLAEAGIPVFAISTYDTDYVLVKSDRLAGAVETLRQAGCTVR